jgi:Fe-S-cluster-containing dehydrogenase component
MEEQEDTHANEEEVLNEDFDRPPRMERCIGCYACSLACARLVNKRLSQNNRTEEA